jgi:hypothetical protein
MSRSESSDALMARRSSPGLDWAQRQYKTARWQRIRAAQLAAEPLCAICAKAGRVTVATVCDHIERHNGDPVKFWNGPFQSLCDGPPWWCHRSTKQQLEVRGYSSEVGPDGYPIDPNHPANR